MTTAQKRALQQTLGAQGYVVQMNNWPKKATYYKPDGEAMPNLPADPMHMQRYMERGFTLQPPRSPQAVAVQEMEEPGVVEQSNHMVCACGFEAKNRAGLRAHERKHVKEKD